MSTAVPPPILDLMWNKNKKVGTALLYSNCCACHCNGCVIFEFNDKLLYVKNDFD